MAAVDAVVAVVIIIIVAVIAVITVAVVKTGVVVKMVVAVIRLRLFAASVPRSPSLAGFGDVECGCPQVRLAWPGRERIEPPSRERAKFPN